MHEYTINVEITFIIFIIEKLNVNLTLINAEIYFKWFSTHL